MPGDLNGPTRRLIRLGRLEVWRRDFTHPGLQVWHVKVDAKQEDDTPGAERTTLRQLKFRLVLGHDYQQPTLGNTPFVAPVEWPCLQSALQDDLRQSARMAWSRDIAGQLSLLPTTTIKLGDGQLRVSLNPPEPTWEDERLVDLFDPRSYASDGQPRPLGLRPTQLQHGMLYLSDGTAVPLVALCNLPDVACPTTELTVPLKTTVLYPMPCGIDPASHRRVEQAVEQIAARFSRQ